MMAPTYDRKRTAAATITDFESTARLQGLGLPVIRVEIVMGSKRAHLTWRNMPVAHDQRVAEEHLSSMYERFSHGV